MDSEKHGRGGIRGRTRSKLREPAGVRGLVRRPDLRVSDLFWALHRDSGWQAASGQVAALGRPGVLTRLASSGTRQLGAGYGLPTPGPGRLRVTAGWLLSPGQAHSGWQWAASLGSFRVPAAFSLRLAGGRFKPKFKKLPTTGCLNSESGSGWFGPCPLSLQEPRRPPIIVPRSSSRL